MPRVTSVMRARVEMQGFTGLSDAAISDLVYWLRVPPLVCGLWAATGLMLGSATVVLALVPFALGGAVLTRHPFDVIYMWGVRRWWRIEPIPRYGAPRRFACLVGGTWLSIVSACLFVGWVTTGRILGAAFLGAIAVQVTTGFCIPSWTFHRLRRRPAADRVQLMIGHE